MKKFSSLLRLLAAFPILALSACSLILGSSSEPAAEKNLVGLQKLSHYEETESWIARWFSTENAAAHAPASPAVAQALPLEGVTEIPIALEEKPSDAARSKLFLASAPGMTSIASPTETEYENLHTSPDRCVCPLPADVKKVAGVPKEKDSPVEKEKKTEKRKKVEASKVSSATEQELANDKKKKHKAKKEKAKEEPAGAVQADESAPTSEDSSPEHVLVKAGKGTGEIRTAAQRVKMSPEMEEARRRKELHEKTRDELLREMLAEQKRLLGGS